MGNKLFGINISKLIKDNIGPGVLDATLTVVTPGTRTPGSLTGGTNPTEVPYACKGFIDSKELRNRAGQLISDGTEKILLIGDTINGGATAPTVNDRITIESTIYLVVGPVDRDPAAATYTCVVRKR